MMKIKDRYEQMFSRFEYLNALAAALPEGVYSYYGRFLWYPGVGLRSESALAEAVDRELKEQGRNWSPFQSGLFGEDFDAFKKAKAEVDKKAVEYGLNW